MGFGAGCEQWVRFYYYMADTVHEGAQEDSLVWLRCEEGAGKDAGRAVMDSSN